MKFSGKTALITGTGRENAELIAWLCTDEARYVVGQNILIDGGRRSI